MIEENEFKENMGIEDYIEEISEALIREGIFDPESKPSEDDLTEDEFADLVEWYADLAESILDFARDEHSKGEYTWFSIEKIENALSDTWLEPQQDEIGKICDYHYRWKNLEKSKQSDDWETVGQMYRYDDLKPRTFLESLNEVSNEKMEEYREEILEWNREMEEKCRNCKKRNECDLQKRNLFGVEGKK
jgi:hypothetical protein